MSGRFLQVLQKQSLMKRSWLRSISGMIPLCIFMHQEWISMCEEHNPERCPNDAFNVMEKRWGSFKEPSEE